MAAVLEVSGGEKTVTIGAPYVPISGVAPGDFAQLRTDVDVLVSDVDALETLLNAHAASITAVHGIPRTDRLAKFDPANAVGTVISAVDGSPVLAGNGSVPDGGTDGQVLTKQSAADGDADWETPSAADPDPGLPTYQEPALGRAWYADFTNQARTNAEFDLSGLTFDTDPGDSNRACLRVTATNVDSTVLVKGTPYLRDVDVRMRYRVDNGAMPPHPSTALRVMGRYLSAADWMNARKSFSNSVPGTTEVIILEQRQNAVTGGVQQSTTADNDITSTLPRYLRFRVIGTLLQMKSWIEGNAEPDWQLSETVTPAPSTWLQGGTAGAQIRAIGATTDIRITELVVTELRRQPAENLIENSELDRTDTRTNLPAGWARTATPTAPNIAEIAAVTDRHGRTRNALRVVKGLTGTPAGWQAVIAASSKPRQPGQIGAKPWTVSDMPPSIEVTLWSRTVGPVTHSDGVGFLAASIVAYYYSEANNGLNVGRPDYYAGLGPNGEIGGTNTGDNTGGAGEWDWTFSRHRIPIFQWWRVAELRLDIGLHDNDVSGELLVHDVRIRGVL